METKKSPPKSSSTLSDGSYFVAYPQVNIPDNNRELQILKQQPEYQSAIDKGVDGSWKKVPCNLVGMCILIQKNTDNLGFDRGITTWCMDTLGLNNTPYKVFGTRYFYDSPNNIDGTFTGKEYVFTPYHTMYLRANLFSSDIFTVSEENPNLPNLPELRPWLNEKECFDTWKILNEKWGYNNVPDWSLRIQCWWEVLWNVDSDKYREWANGVPPKLY